MLGIDNLKKITKFSCDFTKEVASAMEDKKFQWGEVFGFFDEIMAIPGVVKSFPEIGKEIADLDTTERAQLELYLQSEFDIPNDKLEIALENSIMFALSAVGLYNMWKSLNKTEE